MRRLAPALLLLTACRGSEPPTPPDAGFEVKEGLSLRWRGGLPRLPRTSTVPASWATAHGTWRTATAAFSIGNYPLASAAFLDLAEDLREGAPDPGVSATMKAARCMAYENAARAFEGHPTPETGIVALVRARVKDPGCKASITRVLDRLAAATEEPQTETSSASE